MQRLLIRGIRLYLYLGNLKQYCFLRLLLWMVKRTVKNNPNQSFPEDQNRAPGGPSQNPPDPTHTVAYYTGQWGMS